MTVEIKDNHEMLKIVHELEDEFAFEDEFGNVHATMNTVPDNHPMLQLVQKFNGKEEPKPGKIVKTAYLYQAFDWKGNLLAENYEKNKLMTQLRKIDGFGLYRLTLAIINDGIKNNKGKFYWGYIKVKEVEREVDVPKTYEKYEYSAFNQENKLIAKAESTKKLETKLKQSEVKGCIGISARTISLRLEKSNGITRWGHVEVKKIRKVKRE